MIRRSVVVLASVRRLVWLAMLLAGSVLTAAQAPAHGPPQQQPPTFKVQVDYVEVDALVTDRAGRFIRDLQKEDFQVFEDGKPQTLTAFSLFEIPPVRLPRLAAAAVAPIEPDVATNERPFEGRVYVTVLDDTHTSVSRSDRVKRTARQFIERNLGADDLMAVVHTSGPIDASQAFTSNKRLLIAAVDRTMGRKLDAPTTGLTREFYRTRDFRDPGAPLIDPEDPERVQNALATLAALKKVSDWFGALQGRRKTILLVSEGIDYNLNEYDNMGPLMLGATRNDPIDNRGAAPILQATREALAAAGRANVAVYGIDPRGVTDLADVDIETQTYPEEASSRATIAMAQGVHVGPQSLINDLRRSQESLRTVSENTGGFAIVNHDDYTAAFDRIVQDNSSYYVLAYYPPTTDKRDGRFHRIEVRVARPGATVRARQGYAAPVGKPAAAATVAPGAASAEIREALQSPLPVSGLAMRVFAAPFKGTASKASVMVGVEMLGRTLRLAPDNKVELSVMAVDGEGKVRGGGTETLTLQLREEVRQRVAENGIRQLNRIDLPPGRYQLHVAAHDVGGGALGSVTYDLDVPDFNKPALSMSGLALTSPSGWRLPTTRPDPPLSGVLPGPPIALRAFPAGDEMAIFTEIYENAAAPPHTVDLMTTITAADGKIVAKLGEERSSAGMRGKRGGHGYQARIPLRDFAPGAYVLKVEARSHLGHGAAASRELQFVITRPGA